MKIESINVLEGIFRSSLERLRPLLLMRNYISRLEVIYKDGGFKRLLLFAFGKASYQMAEALINELESGLVSEGVIITKYGHAGKEGPGVEGVRVIEAGHPIPDVNGYKATEEIKGLLRNADEATLVVNLISGGGSALLVSPCEGVTLEEKQRVIDLLLRSGADIFELNTVRKHLSGIKGGRFAELAYPAHIISLIISDVIGDRLDVIASGPTSPDPSTYAGAFKVIEKYKLNDRIPDSTILVFQRGKDGLIAETPKDDFPVFKNVENVVIGSNHIALEAAKETAEKSGYRAEILSSEVAGEAKDVGKKLAGKALQIKGAMQEKHRYRVCLISGGETTVTVKGDGKGGRNTELALSFAMEIRGVNGITMLSAGTDGTDGLTDAAGAMVNGETVPKAGKVGLDPDEYLDNNDSYSFFKKIDSLLFTGSTGTNVMDMQIILIE